MNIGFYCFEIFFNDNDANNNDVISGVAVVSAARGLTFSLLAPPFTRVLFTTLT